MDTQIGATPWLRVRRPAFLFLLALTLSLPAAEPSVGAGLKFGGTRVNFDFDGGRGFVIAPKTPPADGSRPWLWYAPTIKGNPGPALTSLFTHLLTDGFHLCGADVGETMANPTARKGFEAFYHHVRRAYGLDAKACLLAQSRGGLNQYHLAAAHPEWVRCIAGIYPVADLRSYPRLERAAPIYGMTVDDLTAQLAMHNPIALLGPIAQADIPILHVHGDTDKLVPLEANSGAIYESYRKLGGRMRLIVVTGYGHEAKPVYFESEELREFLRTQGRGLVPGKVRFP